jgi:peptidoglycan/LPS O-acetylase OafA/YrhL
LPVFAIGIIFYFLLNSPKLKLNAFGFNMLMICTLILLLQFALEMPMFFQKHVLFSMLFLAFAYLLAIRPNQILVNPIITYIGKVSFGAYIVHFIVLFWLQRFGYLDFLPSPFFNFLLKYSMVVGITVFISTILFKYIEMPFQNFGNILIAKLKYKLAK